MSPTNTSPAASPAASIQDGPTDLAALAGAGTAALLAEPAQSSPDINEEVHGHVGAEQEAGPPADRRQEQATLSQTERRKSIVDRRLGLDRRVVDIGSPTGLERRRGPGRRRTDDRRSAEEGEMTDEQFEFMLAIDTYKRLNNRPFPSWTEVLEVVKQLGYRKVAPSTITLSKATGRSV